MADASIGDHWGRGDVYALIVSAPQKAGKPLAALTVEDLAPVDHYHARSIRPPGRRTVPVRIW
jgi:hypothetical protein